MCRLRFGNRYENRGEQRRILLRILASLVPNPYPHSVATLIDHTVLGTQTTSTDIEKICNEAKIHSFKSVCIPPSFVSLAKSLLSDSKSLVCTVVSFPNGYCTSRVKAFETEQAIAGMNGGRRLSDELRM